MSSGRRLGLTWSEHQGWSCLRVRGWTVAELRELGGLPAAELGRRLAVLPSELVKGAADVRPLQSVAGRFEIDQDAIVFVPRFPWLDGMGYSLLVDSAREGTRAGGEVWTIKRPVPQRQATTGVAAIFPRADLLPVNQLKLYIYFSGPMSEGWAARAIHVRRADNGEPLQGVFLATEPELWDRERRRLTILLDPARIKRGLVPHEEAGYPLIEGVPITVMLDAEFRDAAGCPLKAGAERRYEIGPPVRVRVNPADWRCSRPTAGSTDPLTVEFDRPLDHALLEHSLWVNDRAGMAVAGRGSAGPAERCWRFEPKSPWKAGLHQVIVDTRLEDLAGNSIIRVFDRDLTRAEDTPADARSVAIDFTCGPPPTALRTKSTT